MKSHPIAGEKPFGINLFGYLTANLGLGVAARNSARMLLGAGVPTRLVDISPGGGMQDRDTTFARQIEASRAAMPYRLNLFHINPDQVPYLLSPLKHTVALEDRVNVCVPFWELPRIPDSWLTPLSAMDAVLAPTRFVERALRAALPDLHVIHFPQAVHVPADIRGDRAAFDLPDEGVAFVMSFDLRSDVERKNPWGAISAFLDAFPERDDVRLIIKASNVETVAGLDRHVRRLREAAADPRIRVIDTPMTYREILTLYASCDVLVSLHRAEGLGLSLLEAMALGKAVVATGWSGNMDFMTAENSVPIGFDEVPVVASTQPAYSPTLAGRQFWAEPRIAEAAAAMKRLAEDSALRARLGARAAADAASLAARYASGTAILPALEALTSHGSAARRMRALRRGYFANQGRRIARALVYRTKTRLGLG